MVVTIWVARYTLAVNKLSRGIGQTYFYGADGKPWFPLEEHRLDVPLARIAPDLQHAVVAVEDHRFYSHPGVDPIGIGRAVFRDLRAGGIEEGASTLTQQLARTIFLTNQRNFGRKFKEMVLALMIERRLDKPKILELYLNRIFLGGSVYGVEAMSRNVFGKGAADLTLPEAAFIAGIIQMPSNLSPWTHYDRALQRSHVVLSKMREEKFITADAEQAADAAHPKILPSPGLTAGAAGYAEDYLRQQFKAEFEDDNPPDWKVQTTFLPEVQREAERAVTIGLQRWHAPQLQAALVALDPQTGDVLALVGGRDFGRSPFNRATNAQRQPGSAFKPILYAAALESGMSPVSQLSGLTRMRVPGHDEWVVKNAVAESRDSLTLREALYESNNQAAVRLQTQIGSRPVLSLAKALGLPNLPDVPSLALGVGEVTPMQLTAAYAMFPNGGFAVTPRPIVQVLDNDGYAGPPREVARQPVISDAVAFQMVSMLEDVVDMGTGAAARSLGVRFPAGGKTGTTDDFKTPGSSASRPASSRACGWGSINQARLLPTPSARDTRCRSGPTSCRTSRALGLPDRSRRRSSLPESSFAASAICCRPSSARATQRVFQIRRCRCRTCTCDIHRAPARSVTQVLGGIFSGLGRKLGSIFGKH